MKGSGLKCVIIILKFFSTSAFERCEKSLVVRNEVTLPLKLDISRILKVVLRRRHEVLKCDPKNGNLVLKDLIQCIHCTYVCIA